MPSGYRGRRQRPPAKNRGPGQPVLPTPRPQTGGHLTARCLSRGPSRPVRCLARPGLRAPACGTVAGLGGTPRPHVPCRPARAWGCSVRAQGRTCARFSLRQTGAPRPDGQRPRARSSACDSPASRERPRSWGRSSGRDDAEPPRVARAPGAGAAQTSPMAKRMAIKPTEVPGVTEQDGARARLSSAVTAARGETRRASHGQPAPVSPRNSRLGRVLCAGARP